MRAISAADAVFAYSIARETDRGQETDRGHKRPTGDTRDRPGTRYPESRRWSPNECNQPTTSMLPNQLRA